LQGLPRKLASMDACRRESGRHAAEIIAARVAGEEIDSVVELTPKIAFGDTLKRR
ncbi:MAG: LacI family transcriptional regulator, partial [Cognatishimia sp.]|nr:LacI family transcriptional regulator [Cognatishimia sp.]